VPSAGPAPRVGKKKNSLLLSSSLEKERGENRRGVSELPGETPSPASKKKRGKKGEGGNASYSSPTMTRKDLILFFPRRGKRAFFFLRKKFSEAVFCSDEGGRISLNTTTEDGRPLDRREA